MSDLKRIVIVLLGIATLCVLAFDTKGYMDSEGYKNQVNYTTAVRATNKDDFNYAVDSQQGRVLANGTFATKATKAAKFDEMTQGFTYVRRTRQHYTIHTYTTCSGKPTHCETHTYYSWDWAGSDEKYANKITFYGREYNPAIFNLHTFLRSADACTFTAKDTSTGWFSSKHGCSGGDYYLDNDNRYTYDTVPLSFSATFLASTYGGLKPFNESYITLQDKSIVQTVKDVGKYQLIGFWVLIVILVILIAIGISIAYTWVMADGIFNIMKW